MSHYFHLVGAIGVRVGVDLRRRWASWLALAALIGVFAGGVMAIAAGARRTDTAYPRLLAATRAPDALVVDQVPDAPSFASISNATLAALPQVSESAQVDAFTVLNGQVSIIAPTDNTVGYRFWTRKMLAGRLPDPSRADEVTISFTTAKDLHLGVGDALQVHLLATSGTAPIVVPLHVVGVDAAASEFPPNPGTGTDTVWATPAFARAHGDASYSPITVMRFVHGEADGPDVNAEVARLGGGKPSESFLFSAQAVNTQHSIHLQTIALWVLAALLALVGLIIAGQLLARQSATESAGYRDLRALGMTTGQLWAVGMARAGVVGTVAALVAAAIAAPASSLFPLGLAGIAEPHPGFSPDAAAIVIGMAGTLAVVVLSAAWPNWRAARASALSPRRTRAASGASRTAAAARGSGAPVTATTGIAFALDSGAGRSAVPVRTTVTAVIIGVAALTAAIVFSASLDRLLATPKLYGTMWDAVVASNENEGSPPTGALPVLREDPSIDAISVGNAGIPLEINGTRVDGIALAADKGEPLQPTVVAGRLPTGTDEIMLGTRDLSRLHLHLGDTIPGLTLAGVVDKRPLRVVGVGIFPTISDDLGLGQGAYITTQRVSTALTVGMPGPDTILIRFRPGTDKAAAISRLNRTLGEQGPVGVWAPDQPVDLINFGRVENLPLAVGGLLGLLAAGTLAHLLITSIRRRRGDLAVLKILGFVPGQLRRTVAWQANTIAVIALAFGVPIGTIIGRWIWLAFAHQLGVVAVPAVPVISVLILALGALIVANLIALVPSHAAARTRAGPILRAG